jgi:hypothetical protein
MAKKTAALDKNQIKLRKRLLWIPAVALLLKISIISRIQGFDWFAAGNGQIVQGLTLLLDNNYIPKNAWYGADGENYIRGLLGLARDGFLSTEGKLSYWPAGYPLLMWPVLAIFKGSFFAVIALIQSLLYAVACAIFVDELTRTRLRKYSLIAAIFLTLNPTLALNTIAIGYELPAVSLLLIAVAMMMRSFRLQRKKPITLENLVASFSILIATFMQPRLLLLGFVLMLLWAVAQYPVRTGALFLIFSTLVVLVAPTTMIWRNSQANGYAAISTNLGTTMGIGAGPEATGGYNGKYNGVPCPQADSAKDPADADSKRVRCILSWYLENPVDSVKLFWNKARFFWSPWFGPENNGTMARNPWRINHPLNEWTKSESGVNLIFGGLGRFISWLWMLGSLAMLILGFRILWRAGGLERLLGLSSMTLILINWLSSILTIGDNRFRIPTMGLSLFLQAIATRAFFVKKRERLSGASASVEWPSLRWKRESKTDNLPS